MLIVPTISVEDIPDRRPWRLEGPRRPEQRVCILEIKGRRMTLRGL